MRFILMVMGFIFLVTITFNTCTDETYILGYNKNMQEIHHQMFVVDSLVMDLNLTLDSLNDKRN